VRWGLWLLNKVTPPAISFESYDSMKASSPSIRAARHRVSPSRFMRPISGSIALAYTWKGAAKGDPFPRLSRR
jgi:hypothetical protein